MGNRFILFIDFKEILRFYSTDMRVFLSQTGIEGNIFNFFIAFFKEQLMKKQFRKGTRGTFKKYISLSRDYFHNQLIQFDILQFSDFYLK